MCSELIVMTFDRAGKATQVFDALRSMRKSQLLALDNVAIVTWDQAGKVRIRHEQEITPLTPATDRDLLSDLADLIFGALPDKAGPMLTQVELDERFLKQVTRAMVPASSALLFLVRRGSASDVDELVSALKLFEGRLHRTTLTPEAEAVLYTRSGHGDAA